MPQTLGQRRISVPYLCTTGSQRANLKSNDEVRDENAHTHTHKQASDITKHHDKGRSQERVEKGGYRVLEHRCGKKKERHLIQKSFAEHLVPVHRASCHSQKIKSFWTPCASMREWNCTGQTTPEASLEQIIRTSSEQIHVDFDQM